MGFLDFLSSTRRPGPGTPVLGASEVRDRILALNRPTAPYQVRGGSSEHADLIAEWKIADTTWSEIFYKAGLRRTFSIHMRLDAARFSVRAVDYMRTISWEAGFPRSQVWATWSRGQFNEVSSGDTYVFTEHMTPEHAYHYQFRTFEIKTRIQEAVIGCGWTYKGVMFGRL